MTDNEPKTRKPRKTIEEQRAALMAKLDVLEAKENGTYEIERKGSQALKFALRKRKTALHGAQVLVMGRAATSKSPALATIDDKIENLRTRLANLIEGRDNAEAIIEHVPADIELLQGLVTISEAENGETPPMPTDLFRLGDETEVELETRIAVENAAE